MGSLRYQMQMSLKKDSTHDVSSQEFNNQSTLDGCNTWQIYLVLVGQV